jgi:CRISPR-associated endonuclease/helicase Cas3
VEFLQPIVDALRLLVEDYGVTLLLCTATQPNLESQKAFEANQSFHGFGKGEIREVIDDVPSLYEHLKRVKYHFPDSLVEKTSWDELASRMLQHDAVLTIVSKRKDAHELYELLKSKQGNEKGLFHLSALMCAQHRSDVIAKIKMALKERQEAIAKGDRPESIRVVSTQLVEAGVDIDFPVVYRALAGLDSIAQAAGRCNREGRLVDDQGKPKHGEVYVFVPPTEPPIGLLRMAAAKTRTLLTSLTGSDAQPMAPEQFSRYFKSLYRDSPLDANDICGLLKMGDRCVVNFKEAADKFRLIDDKDSATVFVRYQPKKTDVEIQTLLNTLKKDGPERWLMRKLQRYAVTIYRHEVPRLIQEGYIRMVSEGLYVQDNDFFYDSVFGANVVEGAPGDPSRLIY